MTSYNFHLMFFTYTFQFTACLRSVLLFLLLLALRGCQSPLKNKPVNSGQSVFFSPDRIRTIAVIPLNGTNTKRAKEMTRELTVQILQLNRFEVVDHYKVATLVEDEGLEGIDLSDTLVKNISNKLPISRSYFKLKEIIKDHNIQVNGKNIFSMAEAPGGFIQELLENNINKNSDVITIGDNLKTYTDTNTGEMNNSKNEVVQEANESFLYSVFGMVGSPNRQRYR